MSSINPFLLNHGFTLRTNPCVSPDFCLDWPRLQAALAAGSKEVKRWPKSGFKTAAGDWLLVEHEANGDCAWILSPSGPTAPATMQERFTLADGTHAYPASWENLLALKNLVQEFSPDSTLFPTAAGRLGRGTLGVGARFTTLHWPAVEWAMSALELGMTANQNSIPRELVYNVEAMLAGKLDTVPFPFIGTQVPEGHQGQSVEGMSHGSVLSKLKTGFHRRRIPWSFNADHQPIGGKFDVREGALVKGCVLASYITFDLSPELAAKTSARPEDLPTDVINQVRTRLRQVRVKLEEGELFALLTAVWPSIQKMKRRDELYTRAREELFTTAIGRSYLRELSIDELPGLTSPETTAVMLSLCEALGMKIHFIAPAFGFQKNCPYPDQNELERLIQAQWRVCSAFDVSIGFHSGSGKSAENYQVMGRVTGSRLEIKTSGRYTYEMGRALASSQNPSDIELWRDWYQFTLEMAVAGAHSPDETECKAARTFVTTALATAGEPIDVYSSPAATRAALARLKPSPDHMFFFEYNFLFILASGGKPEKASLGDHSPSGYRQRERFYRISAEARLAYAKNVAAYLIFLAEHTGLADPQRCHASLRLLGAYNTYDELVSDISR
ncbi:MAG: tagaturonate epimerase family protein [Opitutaceae bacterium]|nr:tagaturonate epimerase family protein [Opitutaceae bacterium]